MEVRTEYPRPQFARELWQPLNGEWEFCFDDDGKGRLHGYHTGKVSLDKKITVPFTYEYGASGIGDETRHNTVWYRKKVSLIPHGKGKRAILCFNGSDYVTDVWVNGEHVITHEGGFTPFSADVTDFTESGEATIVVRCEDTPDSAHPRGKQRWDGAPYSCYYVQNTGIWQSVWIEYAGTDYISSHTVVPDIDEGSVSGEIVTKYGKAEEAEITLFYLGKVYKRVRFTLDGRHTRYSIKLSGWEFGKDDMCWSPEHPVLFYADFALYSKGERIDLAHTRFGMRKISVDGSGNVLLNNRPIYQRLILDQGYWEESGLTPPSAAALKKDIELALAMGFNGARKHQKFEDPYYYWYADEMGFLVWCEMPSAYYFCTEELGAIAEQWREIVAEAQNFTSIICYVPLNESWGADRILSDVRQQNFASMLYGLTKAVDPSRPVSVNDGWENSSCSDIITIHDYEKYGEGFSEKYRSENYDGIYPAGRKLMQNGNSYGGQPVIFSEFGGIAMEVSAKDGKWGYNDGAKDESEFMARYISLIDGILGCGFKGFCYTQLTDVQQEVNGLLYADRTPKFDMAALKAVTEKTRK